MTISHFRTITSSLIISVSLLFTCQVVAKEHIELDAVIQNVIQAYGGAAALEKVQAVKHKGTVQSHRLGKTGQLERLFVLPASLRVDINYPGGPQEQRLTTPEGAWRSGRAAPAPMHTAMKLQAARFQLPLLLTNKTVTLHDEDKDSVHLAVKLTDSTSIEVQVDKQNWQIVRSIGRMQMGNQALEFVADYSDFRKIGGVLFAHRESLMAMGRPTGIAILNKIEINPQNAADTLRQQSQ